MRLGPPAQLPFVTVALAMAAMASLVHAQPSPPATGAPADGVVDAHLSPVETLPVGNKPLATGLPRRFEGKPLVWDPKFDRMDAPEMVVTGASIAVALAAAIAHPLTSVWKGVPSFDSGARNALRLSSYQARLDARDASDVGLALLTTFPIVVDSMMVAYWYRGSTDVALQMGLIDAETMAVSAALQGAATFLSGRERPYGQDCGTQLQSQSIDCTTPSRYRSFFSGHSTLAFTSAALICAHHEALDLFDTSADPITCATAFVAAAAIGTLRIVGDMHYLSDVLTGAVVGTAVGLGIPLLHHYKKGVVFLGQGPKPEPASASFQVKLVPAPNGMQIVGIF